ncbi:YtxH domain-containing protein [Ulvibacter antarcticus]|uniref:YtxH-like protein n=1 Tax=Ulvibacter antarcticus TaxID=442714 RepID=A0A3L9YUF2_9FLAO|nr:YtxH domain-containing protein [Ulvibacter antarcticus]RMA64381.1 hypothetical protein BXY75_1256 [Ulvibacter antarcticus]
MKRQQKTGLLALLGLGAGAFAFYKYKTMSPEKKAQLKGDLNDAGRKIKDKVEEVESTLSDKYVQLKNTVRKEANDIAS